VDRWAGDGDALWDWNLANDRIHFSPRWHSLVGCDAHEVGTTTDEWFQRVHPHDLPSVRHAIESACATGASEFTFDHRLRHQDGMYRWTSCRGVVLRDEDGQPSRVMGSHADITGVTLSDPVTGLPNRQLFLDRLTQSVDRAISQPGYRFAVLLVEFQPAASAAIAAIAEIDARLLAAAARRLETCLRSEESTPRWRDDDLVARLTSDRFAVLLDGLKDVSRVEAVGQHLIREGLRPPIVAGSDITLSASVGIAVSNSGYLQADDVLGDAETALHRARVLGGSQCAVFDTAAVQWERLERQLQAEMPAALERCEFRVVYQPIVAVTSGRIVGFEALARWQHPTAGELAPADFIPIAERTGFIVPLGMWVLRIACLQLRSWRETLPTAHDLWVSVNLSTVQLRYQGLSEQVHDALRESGLDPTSLVLELTESVAMENPTAVRTVLMQLRAMGVRISIDDFGTGYSSLAYLSQLPVDALKIDKSFIHGIDTHNDKAHIVATLTEMAQRLKLHIVAEGIESEDHLACLRSLNCDSAQGFLFAKPVDEQAATALLKTGFLRQPAAPVPVMSLRAWAVALALLLFCSTLVWNSYDGQRPAPGLRVITAGAAATSSRTEGTTDPSAAVPPADAPSPPADDEPVSLAVSHLHRLGNCEGRLLVSRGGIAFVPSAKTGPDAFSFEYGEFLYSMRDETLTITSVNRDFRFRAAKSVGKRKGAGKLRDLVKTLTQSASLAGR